MASGTLPSRCYLMWQPLPVRRFCAIQELWSASRCGLGEHQGGPPISVSLLSGNPNSLDRDLIPRR